METEARVQIHGGEGHLQRAGADTHATAAAQRRRSASAATERARPPPGFPSPSLPPRPSRGDATTPNPAPSLPLLPSSPPRGALPPSNTASPTLSVDHRVPPSGGSRGGRSVLGFVLSAAGAWMGWASASSDRRRRWAQRSCRTGGGCGVVRRTVAAPAPKEGGTSAAPRRTKGFAHVDKQHRVSGLFSDSRSSSGSTTEDFLCSDFWEFKRKRSSGNSTKCLPNELTRNEIETCHSLPSVMAELMECSAATKVLIASLETSFSRPMENKVPNNEKLLHASSTSSDYGLPYRPRFHLGKDNNNAKQAPPLKNSSGMSTFGSRLARNAERSDSMKISPTSEKCSLAEKMSLLRQPQHGHSYQNQNCISALNRRHKITQSGGAINILRKEKIHKQSDSSTGRHWQTLLDNALVRRGSQPSNEESSEELWSFTNSESDKVVCFSSSGSTDDLQVSFSSDTSDTSDNSKLSSLGIVANDQWKMTFKKVHCPLSARINYISVAKCKEIEQPSPVSVFEPPVEDFSDAENIKQDATDPHDPWLRPELVNSPSVETVAEVEVIGGISDYLCPEMEAGKNDETIQLVEDILEEFGDEEERDFSYLLDILIGSGIHSIKEDELYKVCQSRDCPAGHDVFDKLEKKYMKVAQWSRSDRKLTFDMVNSILSEILAPCLDMHPWVKTARNMAPVWGSDGLLEKVLQMLTQRREELALSEPKPEKKAFDQKWPDLADCIDKAGRYVEKLIKDDLLEELVLELMSS